LHAEGHDWYAPVAEKKKALVHSKAQRGVMIEKLIAFKQGRFYSSF
jgi:hypothetical protein